MTVEELEEFVTSFLDTHHIEVILSETSILPKAEEVSRSTGRSTKYV